MATIYRKNKFNESIEVEKYICGSCKFYQFEREDKDNYCEVYRHYYEYTDHCNKWELFETTSSGLCFLTTCCCEYKGLSDDCKELTTMRKFRDNVLSKTLCGKTIIEQYYKVAPKIVERLNNHPNKNMILEDMYIQILEIVALIEAGEDIEAISEYVTLVYSTEQRVMN